MILWGTGSNIHEFLQVAKARFIAHLHLVDWRTGSCEEHRNASHIPAAQRLNSGFSGWECAWDSFHSGNFLS